MFLGASLKPDYFKQKVNLFIALAPVASTAHITSWEIVGPAQNIDELVSSLVDERKLYNWFPPMRQGMAALDAFCAMFSKTCENLAS